MYYADIRGKDDIFREYLNNGSGYKSLNVQSPEELYSKLVPIDFVIKDSYKNTVGNMRFAGIFSAHVIEHTPDILRHLTDLYECLADDGFLVMAIPDKRYTFDRFREVTPFRDALDVFVNGEKATARMMFDHYFSSHPCNTASMHHANTVSFLSVAIDEPRYINAYKDYCAVKGGFWPNAHVWVFTYQSFIAFLRDGIRSGHLSYSLEYSAPPDNESGEFHIVLKKNKLMQANQSVRYGELLKLQCILDDIDGIGYYSKLIDFCKASDELYIYGAGSVGKGVYYMLKASGIGIDGFVVSDGQVKTSTLLDKPIYYLSELPGNSKNCGILVSLLNKTEIMRNLKKIDINYFEIV